MLEIPVVRVCGGVVCGAIGGTCLVLNIEVPLPVGGSKKQFEMGERFFSRLPLVPLPTISRENSGVEHNLVGVVHDLLGLVRCGAGVSVCNGIIDLPPYNFNGVSGGVCLAEALVVCEPVGV